MQTGSSQQHNPKNMKHAADCSCKCSAFIESTTDAIRTVSCCSILRSFNELCSVSITAALRACLYDNGIVCSANLGREKGKLGHDQPHCGQNYCKPQARCQVQAPSRQYCTQATTLRLSGLASSFDETQAWMHCFVMNAWQLSTWLTQTENTRQNSL